MPIHHRPPNRRPATALIALAALSAVAARQGKGAQEWPVYAGDQAATHYSPLADLTRENVAALKVAWEWKPA